MAPKARAEKRWLAVDIRVDDIMRSPEHAPGAFRKKAKCPPMRPGADANRIGGHSG
jgi:hypothetical protein